MRCPPAPVRALALAIALLGLASPSPVLAQGLAVAAAADLQPVLPALADRFTRETGQPVRLTFGSSGTFFSQIQNGAPFDVFLSADMEYPLRLVSGGVGMSGSLLEYARGRLVVWARREVGLDLQQGLAVLADPRVRRVAIANPAHAPYGRAAVAALQQARLYDTLHAKLVLGESVSQAAQFVQSGNADAGIIALSMALAPALRESGAYLELPPSQYPPIRQAGVVLTRAANPALASRFLDMLRQPDVVRLLGGFGFAPAEGPALAGDGANR